MSDSDDEPADVVRQIDAGDRVDLPNGTTLEILEADHFEDFRGDYDRSEFRARKSDGSELEYREYHLRMALATGATIEAGGEH